MSQLTEPATGQQAAKKKIYIKALTLLSRRELSTFLLRQKLTALYTDSTSAINSVCTQLQADGYLSDTRFAEAYARSRNNKGFGINRIVRELIERGVSETLAKATCAQVQADTDIQNSALYRAWKKKFNAPPKTYQEKTQQIKFLLYRGFSMEEVLQLLDGLKERAEYHFTDV